MSSDLAPPSLPPAASRPIPPSAPPQLQLPRLAPAPVRPQPVGPPPSTYTRVPIATLTPAPVATTGKRKKHKKLSTVKVRRSRPSYWQRWYNGMVVRLIVLAGVGIGGGVYQAVKNDSPATAPTAARVAQPSQTHSIIDNTDGSLTVTEGRVTFWFPAQGARTEPTDTKVDDALWAVYNAPLPSTVQVIVANFTADSTGNEQQVAMTFMTAKDPTKWTLANWATLPSASGRAYSVDMIFPDQSTKHVRLAIGAYSAVAVQAMATDAEAPPVLDHIWSSVYADSQPTL